MKYEEYREKVIQCKKSSMTIQQWCEKAEVPKTLIKNWLFANTPKGAEASAVVYSIVESAKANGLNVFSYLTYLFSVLPEMMKLSNNDLSSVMPWSKEIPHYCKNNM